MTAALDSKSCNRAVTQRVHCTMIACCLPVAKYPYTPIIDGFIRDPEIYCSFACMLNQLNRFRVDTHAQGGHSDIVTKPAPSGAGFRFCVAFLNPKQSQRNCF